MLKALLAKKVFLTISVIGIGLVQLAGPLPAATGNVVTVNKPSPLVAGPSVRISGSETLPSSAVFLDWRTTGIPALGDSDWVQATVQANGTFAAFLNIDHAGKQSTLFYRIANGPAQVAWTGIPSVPVVNSPTPTPTPAKAPVPPTPTLPPASTASSSTSVDTVSVVQPVPLIANPALVLTGHESDPTKTIDLNWRTSGIPAANDADWVRATISPDGSFNAQVSVDHPGVQSTLYYRVANGAARVAWKATPLPSTPAPKPTPVPTLPPVTSAPITTAVPPSLNYVANLPASLPNINFHLTAATWQPSHLTSDDYLNRLEDEARYWSHHQDSTGNLIDPYLNTNHEYSTPFFTYGVATLINAGRANDLLQSGLLAMDQATKSYANGAGSEFFIFPLSQAITLYKNSVPSATLGTWKARMQKGVNLGNTNNWRTYYMVGNWARAQAGIISNSTAVAEIESDWSSNQTARITDTPWNLYHDLTTSPDTLAVEGVGRGNLAALAALGYNGPSAAKIKAVIERGTATSLLMQDASGQAPVNGRTDNHIWVDAANGSIFENVAELANDDGNAWLAGQYRHAAAQAFSNISRWKRGDGSFYITKNHFDPSMRVGYQPASQFDTYNASLMLHTAEAYNAHLSDLSENPSPAEIGGYAFQLDSNFGAAFANAGGVAAQINLRGQISASFNNLWTVLGLVRFSRPGWDTRLGPSDGQCDPATGVGISFAPTWYDGSKWTLLGSHAGTYCGSFSTMLATPALTIVKIIWAPTPGNSGPSFQQDVTFTPDGIFSKTKQVSGESVAFGMAYPLLKFDGATTTQQTISNRIASVSLTPGADEENFILLNTNASAVTPTGLSVRNGFGDLTAARATTSDATNMTYIYPRTSHDLTAAQVRDSFVVTSDGFSSALGKVSGTIYIGQTAGGGYGNGIDLKGDGNPDVTFDQNCNFVVKIVNGEVTAVETDRAVTLTVAGVSTALPAYHPLTF